MEKFDSKTLVDFCTALNFEEESENKQELADAIVEETHIAGARSYLEKMSKEYITDIASAAGVEVKAHHSKDKIITHFLGLAYPHLLEEETTTKSSTSSAKADPNRKKVDLVKGVTYDEIFQSYYLDELKDWLKGKNLLVSIINKKKFFLIHQ